MELLNCDSIEYMKSLPDESIDLIVTDPPYKLQKYGRTIHGGFIINKGIGKTGDCFDSMPNITDYANELYRILKDGTHCYIMVNTFNLIEFLNTLTDIGFHYCQHLIWDKHSKIITSYYYMNQFEHILLLRKGKAKYVNNCGISNILSIPLNKLKDKVNGGNLHDTEKPVSLMEILVTQSSKEGETVLDPFMGIGSTGIACVKNDRNFIGIEIDNKYFNIAKDRIEEESNKLSLDI